jgi:phage terminase large subunit-like protein
MNPNLDIDTLPPEKIEAAITRLEAVKAQRVAENKLSHYRPYPKQTIFHEAGFEHRERLFMCANRFGKTTAGAAELAFHLTGDYPEWWLGKRFDKPVRAWAAGVTGETTRDVLQEKLIGPPFREAEWGTGMIPKAAIAGIATSRGIPAAIDTVNIRHVSGGLSSLQFKSYERGREKWQGAGLEVVYFDEEPDEGIYSEGLTRTNETGGIVYLCFTPLLGMSTVVQRFLSGGAAVIRASITDAPHLSDGEKEQMTALAPPAEHPDRAVICATIDDAPHFSEVDKERIVASYAPHEREARTRGIPVLGSGRIFPVEEETLAIEHREIPPYWPRIGGMDFGWDHPFAAVELAWDRDTDTIYVVRTHCVRKASAVIHAAALRLWGKNLPWAWPRDGRRETLEGAGKALADQYRAQGLEMLHEHAQFEDGSVSVEAGLQDMLIRMESGRFKVFKHLTDWFAEYRLYHRKDGKVFKENDDLMSATRYAVTMLRYASTNAPRRPRSDDGRSWMTW